MARTDDALQKVREGLCVLGFKVADLDPELWGGQGIGIASGDADAFTLAIADTDGIRTAHLSMRSPDHALEMVALVPKGKRRKP